MMPFQMPLRVCCATVPVISPQQPAARFSSHRIKKARTLELSKFLLLVRTMPLHVRPPNATLHRYTLRYNAGECATVLQPPIPAPASITICHSCTPTGRLYNLHRSRKGSFDRLVCRARKWMQGRGSDREPEKRKMMRKAAAFF
jgi:hypothetical protein